MASKAVRIPSEIGFADLHVTRDPQTGDIELDAALLKAICEDNDLPLTENTVSSILVAWYRHHRATGGAPVPAMEQIIAEVEAEAIAGIEIRGGSGMAH